MRVLVFLIQAVLFMQTYGEDYPSAVRDLVARKDSAINRVNQTFVRELLKLQNAYIQSGDLENASKVAAIIGEVGSGKEGRKDDKSANLNGEWRFKFERGKYVRREFKGSYLIDENGGRHPFTRLGDFITIDWGDGAFERVLINPQKPDILEGVNWHGNKLRYERINK